MQITEAEQAEALSILHAAGIERSDATTALRTAIKRATANTYQEWRHELATECAVERVNVRNARFAVKYGQDAIRVAIVLGYHGTN